MQKKLLTVAVASALAMPAVALAQVTVYGTIDGGLRGQTKVVTATGDGILSTATDGLRTTNRWGLKGSEDMGGGLMANFTLEGQYSSDTGAGPAGGATFARKSIVGLSSGGNSVDIGRDYTVNFKSQGIYDPMSYTYTGITPTAGTNTAGVRSSNMVTAGFRFGAGGVRVDYALGEVADDIGSGRRLGVMADFAFGPVTITGALSNLEASPTVPVDIKTTNLGVVFAMGAFKFRGGLSNTDADTIGESPMYVLGVQYAISPTLNARVGYYHTKYETTVGTEVGTRKLAIVALDYSLSKRTTAYVAFDRNNLSGSTLNTSTGAVAAHTVLGVASNSGSTGYSVGIAHAF